MSPQEPLFSPEWYRVAKLCPRLRSGTRVARHHVRGEFWHVFTDPTSGRSLRFNDRAYHLIGRCDGGHTLDQVWKACIDTLGEQAPTQAEAISIISQAFAANLLVGDIPPQASALVLAGRRARKHRFLSAINPLSFRVPLWDPDRFLERHSAGLQWAYTRQAAWAITALVLIGLILFAINAGALIDFAGERLLTRRMAITIWLTYPVVKGIHEMAHAFAVKVYGGEVHDMGLNLLFLTPVPYVDASSSAAFAAKSDRIAVAAAGILIEAALATIALVLWLVVEPGMVSDVAFAVAFIGFASSLLVNANPLLRFDGYYVFSDALELVNLGTRSTSYWRYLAQRYLLLARHTQCPALAPGERLWVIGFWPLSWLYRLALTALLTLVAAQWAKPLGVLVALYGLYTFAVKPLADLVAFLFDAPQLAGRRLGAAVLALGAMGTVGFVLTYVPVPRLTHAPAIVWLPENAMVRAGVEGFIDSIHLHDGEAVVEGAIIAQLSNESLDVELKQIEAALIRYEVEKVALLDSDILRASMAGDEIKRLHADAERLKQKIALLTVRAGSAGADPP